MSDKKVEFSNPDKLPVENVVLTVSNAGVIQRIKALDTYWVSKKEMIPYEAPPSGQSTVLGAVDNWLAVMEVYLEDLKWLLSLKYHVFWSTVLHHPKCMDSLVSFLQEANPPYVPPHENKKVAKLYNKIRRYVLIVFTRLTTDRESEYEWMTEEYMSGILYNNFVFTIPIIWDLCLAYGLDNKELVSQLVKWVFRIQPQYMEDSAAAVAFVNEAFKYIILQVNKDYDSAEPPNLPETFKGFSEIRRPSNSKHPDNITFNMLKDLVVHLLDSAMTLRIFIEVNPDSVKIMKKTNFVNSIVQIYEYGIPQLYEKLEETINNAGVQYKVVEEYIDMARAELIDIFREILAVYKNAIFSGEGNPLSSVEDYLAVMLDGLSERLLIRDYHACYPVHEDIDMLRQAYPQIDPVKTDYILQAIYSNLEEPIPDHLLSTNEEIMNGYTESTDYEETIDYTTSETTDNKIPDNVKQESLISEVKDILPHLGDGFILKCLEHYGFNSEVVISSILENNLDPSLRGLDKSMPVIPQDALDEKYLETGIARLNVFDGDEFDIMHRDDVDTSKIHIGKKKSKYKNLKDMLDDKTDVKKLSNIYTKYSLICDDEALYDDEYDDTYDDTDGPAPAADTTADDAERRPFVTPRALQTKATRDEEEEYEEESEPEEEQAGPSRNKLDFCVNPEVLRARREASFQARRGKGLRPPPTESNKTKDVVGKPKGQGQEKEVLVNRDKKEKHKSARANHNRRQGAQWKRSQGLMPS